MSIRKNLTTVALALTVTVVTAGSAFAFPAWIDYDSNVKNKPHQHLSINVNYVHEGQKVHVIDSKFGWYKIQIPGKDGWVKKAVVTKKKPWGGNGGWGNGGWSENSGASFCINGKQAQFCISGSN
jgi:SH3-like domain-containing protein